MCSCYVLSQITVATWASTQRILTKELAFGGGGFHTQVVLTCLKLWVWFAVIANSALSVIRQRNLPRQALQFEGGNLCHNLCTTLRLPPLILQPLPRYHTHRRTDKKNVDHWERAEGMPFHSMFYYFIEENSMKGKNKLLQLGRRMIVQNIINWGFKLVKWFYVWN